MFMFSYSSALMSESSSAGVHMRLQGLFGSTRRLCCQEMHRAPRKCTVLREARGNVLTLPNTTGGLRGVFV